MSKAPSKPKPKAKLEEARRPDAAVVASMSACVDLAAEPTHNGVLEPILTDKDVPLFAGLMVTAALQADLTGSAAYVVRSNERIYVTGCSPVETRDIDALYLIEMSPRVLSSKMTGRVVALLRPFTDMVQP